MPLITLPETDLIIEIPGTISIGELTVKRRIHVVNLQYNLENKNVTVEGIVQFFDTDDNPVQTKLVRNYPIRMVADNTTYCDLFGVTICSVADVEAEERAAAEAEANGEEYTKVFAPMLESQGYVKEYNWFYNVANSQPIVVNDLIRQFFLRGVQNGRFN